MKGTNLIEFNRFTNTATMTIEQYKELEREAEVGRATISVFKNEGFVVVPTEESDEYDEIENIKKLLDWAKEAPHDS